MDVLVIYRPLALKQLRKAPLLIQDKLVSWARSVEESGLSSIRQTSGWHDEPLKGRRGGQRSIRLNRQWRAIYEESTQDTIILVSIQEVTPHDYRTR